MFAFALVVGFALLSGLAVAIRAAALVIAGAAAFLVIFVVCLSGRTGTPAREHDQRRQDDALQAAAEDRGVRLGVVGPCEQGEVEQVARHAAPAHAPGLRHRDDLGEHLLHLQCGRAGHAHADLVVAGVREAVERHRARSRRGRRRSR